jgi:hypothetical protein
VRFINPFVPRNPEGVQARQIKTWVRAVFELEDDAAVSVAQLACPDAGCPDVETVIAIVRPRCRPQKLRILAPLAAVTEADIHALQSKCNAASLSLTPAQ